MGTSTSKPMAWALLFKENSIDAYQSVSKPPPPHSAGPSGGNTFTKAEFLLVCGMAGQGR